MSNTCIYLDYNFLLLWYFLIRKADGKKRAVKEITLGISLILLKLCIKIIFK